MHLMNIRFLYYYYTIEIRIWERYNLVPKPYIWYSKWYHQIDKISKEYNTENESHSFVSDPLWPHGLYVHGILQARILEWVAFPFSRGSSQPRDQTRVSCIAGGFFTNWANREAQFPELLRCVPTITTWYGSSSLVAQRLKHLPPMWETRVLSLGWEDPLEKEMVTHSSILAWRIPWTEKPGRLQSMGLQRVGQD